MSARHSAPFDRRSVTSGRCTCTRMQAWRRAVASAVAIPVACNRDWRGGKKRQLFWRAHTSQQASPCQAGLVPCRVTRAKRPSRASRRGRCRKRGRMHLTFTTVAGTPDPKVRIRVSRGSHPSLFGKSVPDTAVHVRDDNTQPLLHQYTLPQRPSLATQHHLHHGDTRHLQEPGLYS